MKIRKIPFTVMFLVGVALIWHSLLVNSSPSPGFNLRLETNETPPDQPLAAGAYLNYTMLMEWEEAMDYGFSFQITNDNATHWFVSTQYRFGDFFTNGELSVEWDWDYWLNSTALTSGTRLNRLDEGLTVTGTSRVTVAAGTFDAWRSFDKGSQNTLLFEKISGILLRHVDEDGDGIELTDTNIVQGLPDSERIPGFEGVTFVMAILGVIVLKRRHRLNHRQED
jgi:hypothetical protein